jgi:hypothetical protein
VENVVIPPLLHGCGYSRAEIARPRIGIANTWTELNPGHVHLDRIAEKVREGLRNAGLTPIGFNTIAPCDGISEGHAGMRYILPTREVIADSVEIMARVNRLQGLVLIGSCDKIIPGLLMAAARVEAPRAVRREHRKRQPPGLGMAVVRVALRSPGRRMALDDLHLPPTPPPRGSAADILSRGDQQQNPVSRTSDVAGDVEFRSEGGKARGSPHVAAEALEALRSNGHRVPEAASEVPLTAAERPIRRAALRGNP